MQSFPIRGRFVPCWCGLPPANHNTNLAAQDRGAWAGHEYAPIKPPQESPFVRRARSAALPTKEL